MRKITLLAAILCSVILSAQNTSTDTTFVTTNQVDLDYYNDFDLSASFPNGTESYRKIIMTLELGQYDCDPGADFCHQWDYDVHISLVTDDDKTYEMGRFITPFATSGWSRFGSTWKQPYVFDVTDFYPLLKDQKTIRIHYAGYSGGFTAKIKFAFIEGIPERSVLGIKKAFEASQTYGDSNDPFNDHLTTFSDTAPEGTTAAQLKVLVTGHGSDDNQCCEFDQHFYKVLLDESQIDQVDMWRNDCGVNDLYPQGGTWIYNRSNWCPGAKVIPLLTDLPNITDETAYDLDVQFENYNGSGNLGNYKFNALVFYYGEPNHELDAAITDIVAPTNDPNHYRANPSGSIPTIKVRNTGGTEITSIDFSYGVVGYNQASYTWSGNLPALTNKTIDLPELESLTDVSLAEEDSPQQFEVTITSVNTQEDSDESNNFMSSNFEVTPKWSSTIIVKMKTSSLGANGSFNSSPADVSWEITDMEGNVVASRTNADVKTSYKDTVSFIDSGFYKLKLTSVNCFGLHWWVLDQGYPPQYYQAGNFKVTDPGGTNLPLHNYTYSGTEHDDWGCSYTQYFSVNAEDVGVEKVSASTLKVYPIPAESQLNIDITEDFNPPYEIRLINILGETVYQTTATENHTGISVDQFSEGLYFLHLESNNHQKQIKKVLIK